jgi:predicted esterase
MVIHGNRVGMLYVPRSYQPGYPAPFALMLHGAGGNAQQGIGLIMNLAEDTGMILVALDAVGRTWDVIATEYGPDVHRVDLALHQVFANYNINRKHVAIGGFSDGASYALSLGLGNGDLFNHIIAFSPGFMQPASKIGHPVVFVSHGTKDRVLPIDRTSRRIVPSLRDAGYAVEYVEFDGPHSVPPAIAVAAVGWFLPEELTLPRSVA